MLGWFIFIISPSWPKRLHNSPCHIDIVGRSKLCICLFVFEDKIEGGPEKKVQKSYDGDSFVLRVCLCGYDICCFTSLRKHVVRKFCQ